MYDSNDEYIKHMAKTIQIGRSRIEDGLCLIKDPVSKTLVNNLLAKGKKRELTKQAYYLCLAS